MHRHQIQCNKSDDKVQLLVQVPTAAALFPKEIFCPPKNWAQKFYNIQQWTVMSKGGHFAAKEEPEALANDIQKFFGNRQMFERTFGQHAGYVT